MCVLTTIHFLGYYNKTKSYKPNQKAIGNSTHALKEDWDERGNLEHSFGQDAILQKYYVYLGWKVRPEIFQAPQVETTASMNELNITVTGEPKY